MSAQKAPWAATVTEVPLLMNRPLPRMMKVLLPGSPAVPRSRAPPMTEMARSVSPTCRPTQSQRSGEPLLVEFWTELFRPTDYEPPTGLCLQYLPAVSDAPVWDHELPGRTW